MRQTGLATRMFVDDNNDWLPPGEGKTSGLGGGQGVQYSTVGPNGRPTDRALVYYIATYLGLPAPDQTLRTAKVFQCPGGLRYNKNKDDGLFTYYVVITSNNSSKVWGQKPLLPWNPFGYYNPSSPPHRMSELNPYRPSELWMMVDNDQVGAPQAGWSDTIPSTPVHGSGRNYLFFDGHVGFHKLTGDQRYSAPFNY
jgi:prepilin-type processing-associated H-X9-DG protein